MTDGDHHIKAISQHLPGAKNDKKLSDETKTVNRLPDDVTVEPIKATKAWLNR